MPPPDSHKTLKPEQIETLKRWVAEGGAWGKHWSFEPIVRGKYDLDGGQTVIDLLIQTELHKKSLKLREPAPPHQLVRRAYLDLIGVPPTIEEADAFAANPSDAAWEKLIDDLLARPEFGNSGLASGWTWPGTQTRRATKKIWAGRCGPTAIG